MQRVYSHPDLAMVHLVKNELTNRGISSEVRGQHTAAIIGAGAGIDAWIELWVEDDALARAAVQIVQQMHDEPEVSARPWICIECGTEVDGAFGVCWKCGASEP